MWVTQIIRDFRQTVEREACTRDSITQSTCMTENKKKMKLANVKS